MINAATMGKSLSATIASGLYVRKGQAARARMLVTGAVLTGVFFFSMHGLAEASGAGFDKLSTTTVERTNTAANLVTYVSYIGGAILAALGVVDLKKHVENPGQNPMKNGLAKLGFGAMLIALPFITDATMDTFGSTDTDVKFNKLTETAPTL